MIPSRTRECLLFETWHGPECGQISVVEPESTIEASGEKQDCQTDDFVDHV